MHGRKINNGLLYSGINERDWTDTDACLIDSTLPAASPRPSSDGTYKEYFPRYSDLTRKHRGEYLDWLAGGCKDPNVSMSYVFLYFYGLEKRLLVDSQADEFSTAENKAIVKEILRLLSIYGKNTSFNRYANNLLVVEWLLSSANTDLAQIPEYIDINNTANSVPIRIYLGLLSFLGKNISPEIALIWYNVHPDYELRTPARRCSDEFIQLFTHEYNEVYDEGILLPRTRKKLEIAYNPASPSIEHFTIKVDLPDCFDNAKELSQIKKIVDSSTEQLQGYSRYLAKSKGERYSLKGLSLLPPTIVNETEKAITAKRKLNNKCKGLIWFPKIKDVYKMINQNSPKDLSRDELTYFVTFLQLIGFGVCPDIRYHKIKLKPDSHVSVFPFSDNEVKFSEYFESLSQILRLGAIMSRIDGHIHEKEEAILWKLIDNTKEIGEIELKYQKAFLYWCFNANQEESLSSMGIKSRIAQLSDKVCRRIADLLIDIIYADGYVKDVEVTKLEQFYELLGLEPSLVHKDIDRHKARPRNKFALDDNKIENLRKEYHKMLASVFAETDEEQVIEDEVETATSKFDAAKDLTKDCYKLYEHMIAKKKWQKQELTRFCDESKIMLDGAVESINEWTNRASGAPLVSEIDEILYIDTELLEELTYDRTQRT